MTHEVVRRRGRKWCLPGVIKRLEWGAFGPLICVLLGRKMRAQEVCGVWWRRTERKLFVTCVICGRIKFRPSELSVKYSGRFRTFWAMIQPWNKLGASKRQHLNPGERIKDTKGYKKKSLASGLGLIKVRLDLWGKLMGYKRDIFCFLV